MFSQYSQITNVSLFLLVSLGLNLITTSNLAHPQPSISTIQLENLQTSIPSVIAITNPTQLSINKLPSTKTIAKSRNNIIQERDSSSTGMSAGAIAGLTLDLWLL